MAANSEYVMAASALVTPARTIETTIAEPEPTWPASPLIAVPIAAKIAAPMIAPIPSAVSRTGIMDPVRQAEPSPLSFPVTDPVTAPSSRPVSGPRPGQPVVPEPVLIAAGGRDANAGVGMSILTGSGSGMATGGPVTVGAAG